MTLDDSSVSTSELIKVLNEINDQQKSVPKDRQVQLSIHDNSNFRDAAGTINDFIIDVVIINISTININKYKEDCMQLRSIYSFAPIIATTNSSPLPNLSDYNYIGFDDILNIESISPNTLLRAVLSAIQRSKNYHSFHTSNQRKLINNKLLKLLLEKRNLSSVAESACQIINSKSLNSNNSSASIYSVHDDKVDCIGHSGTADSDDTIFEYQKEIYTLKHSGKFNDDFNFIKSKTGDSTRFTIPLNNKNSTFAFLKIETEYGIVHPSEEHTYYKNISNTLSEILLLAQEREHFEQLNQQNTRLIDEMSSAAVGINKHDEVTHWNHQAEIYFGIKKSEAINKRLFHLNIICDWPVIISKLYDSLNNSKIIEKFEVSYKRDSKEKDRILSIAITPFTDPNGSFIGYLLLMDDITEKKHLEKAHQQSMYLESIGQLSAGIAHEINTPMQYISDNLNFLKDSFNDVAKAITHIKRSLLDKTLDEAKLDSIYEEADIEYLNKELPLAFGQTTDGVERVCSIVKAMKEYSHPNSEEKVATNINHCIESTITISKHTWKYHSDMEVILDPDLPEVMCHPGPFNEVILNIVVNAADAIRERVEEDDTIDKGKITIETIKKESHAEIRISDTGGGIPKSIQEKIFDPFFTTKSVGKGTGQGLALSYSIIKERHNGELQFETVPGESTTFIIQLPYNE
jgi:PAS domain S-box-containing protein